MPETAITSDQLARQEPAAAAFAEAAAIMARLRRIPDGCPWDLQQTFDSIQPHTLEEVYEVFDAIDRRAWPDLRDELGDLLLQVLFYAQIASDEGHFSMADVVRGLSAKLLRRHPHIFADALAATPEAVVETWDRVKQSEKPGGNPRAGLLDSVLSGTPALMEARKIGSRVAKVGFDWPNTTGVFDKIEEELAEVKQELRAGPVPNHDRVEEELGDLLFTLASLGRHLHVDPEQALRKANAKFRRRFAAMEREAGGAEALQSLAAEQLEAVWKRVKEAEKTA